MFYIDFLFIILKLGVDCTYSQCKLGYAKSSMLMCDLRDLIRASLLTMYQRLENNGSFISAQ